MMVMDRLGPRPTDEVRMPSTPESAARARRVAMKVMRLWGLAPQVDIAELLVSELVGNVVRHTGVRTFGLNLGRRRGWVRVEVRDASRSLPCLISAGSDAESGRGLVLVDMLADRWGVDLLPRGKSVWFELRTPDRVPG
jgi:anti-sigma regulatory factor (Ser/Thr protein kinase)